MKNTTKQLKKGAVGVLAASLVLTPVVLNAKQVHSVYAAAGSIAVTDAKVTLGEAFDAMKGVKGTDSAGNDATGSIKVVGSVDTQTEGKYTLVYEMTSATGEKVTATRVVTVEKTVVNAPAPVQKGDLDVYAIMYPEEFVTYEGYDIEGSKHEFKAGMQLSLREVGTDKEVAQLTTTGKKDVFKDVPYGSYYIQVLSAPAGYTEMKLSHSRNEASVAQPNGNKVVVGVREAKSGFYVHPFVKGANESQVYVSGVEFEVKDASGKIVYTYVSNENEKSFVLPDADYTITLTKVPSGYKVAEKTQKTQSLSINDFRSYDSYEFELEKEVSTQPKAPQATNNQKDDTRLPDTGGKKAKFFPWF